MTSVDLPRLLYLADVPVESSYHGSALLYRLLQTYPQNKLRIIEGSLSQSLPNRRIPGVSYEGVHFGYARLMNTRLHEWHSLWLSLRAAALAGRVSPLLGDFAPEAVLTVGHGHLWVTAAQFAQRRRLPLHLIVHDDWPTVARLPPTFRGRVSAQFRDAYRAATSRLCVSPFMEKEYTRRYGVGGIVLYPSRAQDAEVFDTPPDRLGTTLCGMACAFAGTINTSDHCRLLRMLAESLEPHDGRLLIFGPTTADQAAAVGLNRPNVQLCGLLTSTDLMKRLRAEVDVLFVPMSFAPSDRTTMEVNFPSKLTDYTAVGVPLLIMGPAYSSAVQWADENTGVAEVVRSDDRGTLGAAIQRLVNNSGYRLQLATAALAVGDRFFSHAAAQSQFHQALRVSRVA